MRVSTPPGASVLCVIYVFSMKSSLRKKIRGNLDVKKYFTHTLPPGIPNPYPKGNIALLFVRYDKDDQGVPPGTYLEKIGVILHPSGDKVATVGRRIKVDLVRSVGGRFPLRTLRDLLSADLAGRLEHAIGQGAHPMPEEDGKAILDVLKGTSASLAEQLGYFRAVLERDLLDHQRPEDRFRQEERDAVRVAARIGGFTGSRLEVWKRPKDADAPYLAGLIKEPNEQALIEADTHPIIDFGQGVQGRRRDIEVLVEGDRRLEIVNVNATQVEARLGTDLIYYHHNTQSFVFVQYKRIPYGAKSIRVDARLRSQLDRMEKAASLSRPPRTPEDWRLSSDPCFVKLAQWEPGEDPTDMTPGKGLYLPVSYVRLLLEDPRIRGARGGTYLGYDTVSRYLTNTEFIDLVKTGLVGTVGTTVEALDRLVRERLEDQQSVMVAVEHSFETASQRQARQRSRGGTNPLRRPQPQPEPLF